MAVGAKGVGFDQLRARGDEARVQGDDALGSADVRLLRTAQAGDGAGDEDAHAAVGDDRRAAFKPFLESIGHLGK